MNFIGSNLAREVSGDCHLLRPGNLNRPGLRDSVDWSELNSIVSHVVEADVSLSQFILHDVGGKFVFDTISLLVSVSSYLVEILVLDFDFFKGVGRPSGDRIADVVNTPTEVSSRFLA